MTTTTAPSALVPGYLDVTRPAVASFLARYREPTRTAYTQDLKAFLGWCQTYDREVLRVTRGQARDVRALPRRSQVRRGYHRSSVRHGRHVLQVRGDRRGHRGQPGSGRDPSVCGCRKPARPTSPTSAIRPATSCYMCSARAPSPPTSRCPSRCCARSGEPSTVAARGRSARTVCAALSAPPGWSPASASETCSTRCATPTHAVAAYLAGMSTG
jgi:hypothetical protein